MLQILYSTRGLCHGFLAGKLSTQKMVVPQGPLFKRVLPYFCRSVICRKKSQPQAQGGARFLAFHAPPCADFLRFSSAIDFGAPLARLVKTSIFFKLQAGVSLVSAAPTPPRTTPAPHPKSTIQKSLYHLHKVQGAYLSILTNYEHGHVRRQGQ